MKRILSIIPFENIYPPMNGGMMRCINLLDQLAKRFNLTIMIRQDKTSFLAATREYPALKKCTVISTTDWKYSSDLFSFLPSKFRRALRFRIWNRSLSGPADTNFLLMYPILTEILQKETFNHIILEDMAILNLAKIIRKYQPETTIIYDAYNVNTRLAKASLEASLITQKNYERIKAAESSLSDFANYVFTCSENDLEELTNMNNGKLKGFIVPNGVTIKPWRRNTDGGSGVTPHILFCGSLNYLPNIEGLNWFYQSIWPIIKEKFSAAEFIVVGSGSPHEKLAALQNDGSIQFKGMVPEVAPFYKEASVSIVPLLSGSGTRLKILEAMSYGVPIVATTVGAEGINYLHGKNICIADSEFEFAHEILNLLQQKEKNESIALEAYRFVKESYDWDIIGGQLGTYLEKNGVNSKREIIECGARD